MFALFLTVLSVCLHSGLAQIIQPCKVSDDACILQAARDTLPKLWDGVPSLGVPQTDPLIVDEVDGNLSVLKFNISNTTVVGLRNCKIDQLKLHFEELRLGANFTCTNLDMDGDYTISGRLILLPVEGNGTFQIYAKKYKIGFDSELKKSKGKDSKEHLQIKNFKLSVEALDGIRFDFQNLFNGQKELGDAVIRFANENWKEVSDFIQQPVLDAIFKKIISHTNKLLKTVPIDDILLP